MPPAVTRTQRILAAVSVGCLSLFLGPDAGAEETTPLPVRKVVLFNSGVAYFEHQGMIEGDVQVDLTFDAEDINDLLKSMVLQDLGDGQVSAVTYASKDPLEKTLQAFDIDLTEEPTIGDLLRQIRGEEIRIDAQPAVTGVIVGVELRAERSGDEVAQLQLLNLLTKDGLRSIPLNSVGAIQILNKKLDAEFRQALTLLTARRRSDSKLVSLHFRGAGRRPVRVGYVQQSPVWKTSYRLVVQDANKALLQGWAIVENTGQTDWDDVQLTLVSGRPVSFVMDLYQPLYVERPRVAVELYGGLKPQLHQQDLASGIAQKGTGGFGGGFGGGGLGGRPFVTSVIPVVPDSNGDKREADPFANPLDPSQGVSSQASGVELGELFQYQINQPVTLKRRRSAMLPIVNDPVRVEKVDVYNAQVDAKHPLNAIRLTNTTALHLMQGPVTVFDQASYAGDASFRDIPPGNSRLLSYALDLNVEINREASQITSQLTGMEILEQALVLYRSDRRTTVFRVLNSDDRRKDLLLEMELAPDWTTDSPKAAEITRDLQRFAVEAEPGKAKQVVIDQSQKAKQHESLPLLEDLQIADYLVKARAAKSEAVAKALEDILKRRQVIAKTTSDLLLRQENLNAIFTEQSRIRENMKSLDRTADLYARYVLKLKTQEDQVETLNAGIQQLQQQLARDRQELQKQYSTNSK